MGIYALFDLSPMQSAPDTMYFLNIGLFSWDNGVCACTFLAIITCRSNDSYRSFPVVILYSTFAPSSSVHQSTMMRSSMDNFDVFSNSDTSAKKQSINAHPNLHRSKLGFGSTLRLFSLK